MPSEVAEVRVTVPAELQEKVLLGGDLAKLTPAERLSYYNAVCTSVGLNPLTRPFEYITLNGRLTLYARKDCTDQLRDLPDNQISVELVDRQVLDGIYVVTARAKNLLGRTDESVGAVPVPASPADKANAMMKAETKAKRRVTLSICGLGILDESELDTIADVRHPVMDAKRTAQSKIAELRMEQPQGQGAGGGEPTVTTPQASDSPAAPSFIWRITGKHKDESIATIDSDYLAWFVTNGKNAKHVEEATLELDRRRGQGTLG